MRTALLTLALSGLALPLGAQRDREPVPGGTRILGTRMRPTEMQELGGVVKLLFPQREEDRKVTVVVFWSLRDPLARGYVPKVEALRRDYRAQKVEVLLVDSNHDEVGATWGEPLEKLRAYARDEDLDVPLLIDRGNVFADAFEALCANHAFVVGLDNRVHYAGGIDDDPRGKLEERGQEVQTWLRDALDAVLAGSEPDPPQTRPVGRPIKRAPVETAREAEKDA